MSIVFDYADIAARMNCKPECVKPEAPAFTGVATGGVSAPLLLRVADLPPFVPSQQWLGMQAKPASALGGAPLRYWKLG